MPSTPLNLSSRSPFAEATGDLPTASHTTKRPLNQSSRPRPPRAPDIRYPISGGRAEGPLLVTESLLDRAGRDYLAELLHQIQSAEDQMYFTYILASRSGTLYVGMTNNMLHRLKKHRERINKGFTSQYLCTKLVYFEIYYEPMEAIEREKQIKNWSRVKKERLIKTLNAAWIDLSVFLPAEDDESTR